MLDAGHAVLRAEHADGPGAQGQAGGVLRGQVQPGGGEHAQRVPVADEDDVAVGEVGATPSRKARQSSPLSARISSLVRPSYAP